LGWEKIPYNVSGIQVQGLSVEVCRAGKLELRRTVEEELGIESWGDVTEAGKESKEEFVDRKL